jgi:hypothetical protein
MSPSAQCVVGPFEGFAAPERDGGFECLRFAVGSLVASSWSTACGSRRGSECSG